MGGSDLRLRAMRTGPLAFPPEWPERPLAEDRAPVMGLRFSAPELQGGCNDSAEAWQQGLNFALTLRAPKGKSFCLSRVIGKIVCQLKVEGLEVEGFDTNIPLELRKYDKRLDEALEAVELRNVYYEELQKTMSSAAETVLNLRTQCLKELDRLREEVHQVKLSKGLPSDSKAADVTFFHADQFVPPSWDSIMVQLDEMRWQRLQHKAADGEKPTFKKLADIFRMSSKEKKGHAMRISASGDTLSTGASPCLLNVEAQTDISGIETPLGTTLENVPQEQLQSAADAPAGFQLASPSRNGTIALGREASDSSDRIRPKPPPLIDSPDKKEYSPDRTRPRPPTLKTPLGDLLGSPNLGPNGALCALASCRIGSRQSPPSVSQLSVTGTHADQMGVFAVTLLKEPSSKGSGRQSATSSLSPTRQVYLHRTPKTWLDASVQVMASCTPKAWIGTTAENRISSSPNVWRNVGIASVATQCSPSIVASSLTSSSAAVLGASASWPLAHPSQDPTSPSCGSLSTLEPRAPDAPQTQRNFGGARRYVAASASSFCSNAPIAHTAASLDLVRSSTDPGISQVAANSGMLDRDVVQVEEQQERQFRLQLQSQMSLPKAPVAPTNFSFSTPRGAPKLRVAPPFGAHSSDSLGSARFVNAGTATVTPRETNGQRWSTGRRLSTVGRTIASKNAVAAGTT